MSTVKGDNYTIHDAGGPPGSFLQAGLWMGKVRVQCDKYEAASIASGTVIKVGNLPKDAFWLALSNLMTDALGSGVTISVGITGTAAKFLAATACNTANQQKFCSLIDGAHYKFTADTDIILTTGGAAATGTIKTELYYSQE